jgi:hypothetical protein
MVFMRCVMLLCVLQRLVDSVERSSRLNEKEKGEVSEDVSSSSSRSSSSGSSSSSSSSSSFSLLLVCSSDT